MKYTEKKARLVADRHNLSASALRVWKIRGEIPDFYFSDNYTRPIPAEEKDMIVFDRICHALRFQKLNLKAISEEIGHPYHTLQDVMNGQYMPSQQLVADLSRAIESILTRAKNIVSKSEGKKEMPETAILQFKEFVQMETVVLSKMYDKPTYTRLVEWRRDRINFPAKYFPSIVASLSLFVDEFSIKSVV